LCYAHNLYVNGVLVTDLVIPDGVARISEYAFYNCSGLTSVTIPDSVTIIGREAFYGCDGLSSVAIPNSVKDIGRDAFSECSALRNVAIPQCVCTNYIKSAFPSSYESITNVTICEGVTDVSGSTFSGCLGVKSVKIPGSVKCFSLLSEDCSELDSVYITDLAAWCRIGSPLRNPYGLYLNGSSVAHLTIPEEMTSIGYAFEGCTNLTGVTIAGNIDSIGAYAFRGCSGLTSVTISDSVTSIGYEAFYGCSGLTGVTIPNSVTSIGDNAFRYCSGLSSVTIGNGVTSIGDYAFRDCSGLTSVTVPQYVLDRTINDVFPSAYSLITNVSYSSVITNIGYYAFYGCSGLTHVTIPDSVTSIGDHAFSGCRGLTSITIPDSVTNIGFYVFEGCGIRDLTVPQCALDLQIRKLLSYWEDRSVTNVSFSSVITNIGDMAFSELRGLERVIIPDGVTSIGSGAFSGCSGLTSVRIPDSVTYIGDWAFAGCSVLTDVSVPDGVMAIGDSAFHGCVGLADADGFITIRNVLHGYAGADENVIIPDSVISIGEEAFRNCDSITNVVIPASVTNIGESAFAYCDNLKSCKVPCNVTRIGSQAFERCTHLYNVAMPDVFKDIPREEYGISGGYECPAAVYYYKPHQMVTFDVNGGTVPCVAKSVDYGLRYGTLPKPLRTGYSFAGWMLYGHVGEAWDYGNEYRSISSESVVTEIDDHTIVAQWQINQYEVTFDANGGTGGTNTLQDYATDIAVPNVMREGYSFVGWTPAVAAIVPATNVTYTAQWRINQYNVTFDANGGDGGTTVSQDYGSTIAMPSVSKAECTFMGWKPSVAATVPASNVMYTAQWLRHSATLVCAETSLLELYKEDDCTALTDVVLQEGIRRLPDGFFNGCDSIVRIDVPSTLESIGYDDLPTKVRTALSYDANGFMVYQNWLLDYQSKDASSIVVPEGIIGIGAGALAGMYDLETVDLPQSLKYIAEGAFREDTYLDNLVIPDGVEIIGDGAFEDCSFLQTMTLGKGVNKVGARAFAGCTQLSGVVFGEGLAEIGAAAFDGCWRMLSASLPLSVTNVASTAFNGCTSLAGVTVPTHGGRMSEWFAPVYSQIRDVTVPDGETKVRASMFEGCGSLRTVQMPDSITNIAARAFYGCSSLPEVRLPESLLTVGGEAFRNCSSLTAAALPENVTSLGARAYQGCSYLSALTLPRGLEALTDYVFADCWSLDSFVVPAAVTNLGSYIVSSGTTAIYYLGNAPAYVASVYGSASGSLKSYVILGTKGWDGRPNSRDIPASWNGREILTWSANQFDVTFDANGGLFFPVVTNTYACEEITYTGYSLPPFEPVCKGMDFDGYWTEPGGGTRVFTSTRALLTKPHTLYAHWKKGTTIKVRFNACGGTVSPAEDDYVSERPYCELPVPVREHFVFAGWWTEAGGCTRVEISSEAPKAAHELFAHWTPAPYTICFHANNGTDETVDQYFTYGDAVTLRANTFGNSGDVFAGWALSKDGPAVYADGKTLTDVAAIQDNIIHLYAVWEGARYTVRFDSHGGLGRMDDQTFVIGVAQPLLPCVYRREGFKFIGWALSTTAGVSYRDREKVMNLSTIRDTTVTLYAVWEAVVTPNPQPTPEPEPEPLPMPELGEGDYEVGGEMSDTSIPENAASVYDGYVYSGNKVVGTIQAKVAKPKNNIAKVTATIQITGEKKVSVKGELDVASGKLEAYAKDGRELYLEFGSYGVKGSFGSYEIDGTRNFFSSKDKGEKSAAEEILKPYLGAYSMICDGGILSVNIAKKGKVTVKGTIDGNKVSAKAQVLIGEDVLCIPVIYSKKSVNLAFTIWLPIDGSNAEVIGLGDNAIIGKAGTLKNGAQFIIDGDIGASIETEDERTLELLPNNETITVSKSKWVVADGIKAAKVAYKKGEFTITEGKKGAGIVNPSGLKLTYKSKDGSFSGSFTVYAIVKGKLKKHKAIVEGVLVNGIGYGSITIKKIGTWVVTIE